MAERADSGLMLMSNVKVLLTNFGVRYEAVAAAKLESFSASLMTS